MSPRQVRERLGANRWSSLPILRGEKRPTLPNWSRFAEFGAAPPTVHEVAFWERSHPGEPGTGIACGDVVGIDIDVEHRATVAEIEAIAFEVFGETPFIRVGRAPREMLVYRAAERIPKQAFTGLDVLGAGSQFVAFAIHPEGHLYEWIGDESPLTARPDAAPLVTSAQVDAFVSRLAHILELAPAGSRKSRQAGGGMSTLATNDQGKVVDGRDGYLSNVVYRAIADLDAAGSLSPGGANYRNPAALELVARLAWERFCNGAVLDVGGKVIEYAEAVTKARGKLNAYAQRRLPFQAAPASARPSHDVAVRVSLDEAEAEQKARIGASLDRMLRWATARRLREAGIPIPHGTIPLLYRVESVACETGLGKSRVAIEGVADIVRKGARVAVTAQTVALAEELAERFGPHRTNVRVWYGRGQPDPIDPTYLVCRRPNAARLAERSRGGKTVSELICGKGEAACPLARICYYQRQLKAARQDGGTLWLFAHATLFIEKPEWLDRLDGLVADESLAGNAIGTDRKFDADRLRTLAALVDHDGLTEWFSAVAEAIRHGNGFMTRDAMAEARIDYDTSCEVAKAAQALIRDPVTEPEADEESIVAALDASAEMNNAAADLADLASEFAAFLDREGELVGAHASGRLRVYRDPKTSESVLIHRPFRGLGLGWQTETLSLDATPAPEAFMRAIFPSANMTYGPRILARWPESVRLTQIIRAPSASHALGLGWRKESGKSAAEIEPQTYREWAKFIEAESDGVARVGFIAQKDAVEALEAGLPSNVTAMHFGKIAGFDGLRDVRKLIVVGQPTPPPQDVESIVGCFTGAAPACLHQGSYYEAADGGIALAAGGGVATRRYRHPDPQCEAVRYWICEGAIEQAIGRARYLRRDDLSPLEMVLASNVPTALPVSDVRTWRDVKPSHSTASPIVFQSETDAAKALGISRHQAREHVAGFERARTDGWRVRRYKIGNREGALAIPHRLEIRPRGERGPNSIGRIMGTLMRAVEAIGAELEPSPGGLRDYLASPATRIARAVRDAGGKMSEREIRRRFGKELGEGGLFTALRELVEDEEAEVVELKTSGRPSVIIRLIL